MSSIKKLRRLKEKSGSSLESRLDLLLELGQELLSEGRLSEALQEFEELEDLSKDSELECFAYRKSGEVLEKLGDYPQALKKLLRFHEVSLGNPLEVQRALTTLGGHFLSKSEFLVYEAEYPLTMDSLNIMENLKKASEYSQRAESAIKDILDPNVSHKEFEEMRSALYANQFKISYYERRHQSSEEFFLKAERIMIHNKFSQRLISLYECRSILEHRSGKLESALALIDKAIQVSGSKSCKELILRDKALILVDLRSFNKAQHVLIDAYKSAPKRSRDILKSMLKSICKILKILDEEDSPFDEAKKMEALGDACVGMEAYHAALWYYDTAVGRLDPESPESGSILSGLYTSLAMTYKDLKMFSIASDYYLKELSLSKNVPEETYKTLMALSVTSDLEGKSTEVVSALYTEARTIVQKMGDLMKELHCLNEFLQFLERRGESEGDHFKAIKIDFDSLLSDNDLRVEDIVNHEEESGGAEESAEEADFDIDDLIFKIESNSGKRNKRSVSLKKDLKGETELHRKVKISGNTREVSRLIAQSVFVDIEDNAKYTPLHEACNHGMLDYVMMLVEAGADVNKASDTGTTPLISAAVNGHMGVMEYLLDQGAKPYHQDEDGWSCFDYFKEAEVDKEDDSYRRLSARLSRAIETKVATGLRLEPKKHGSSALILVRNEYDLDDEDYNLRANRSRQHEALRSIKVNEKITKYSDRSSSLRTSDPLETTTKKAPSSKAASEYRKTIASLGLSGASSSGAIHNPTSAVKSKAEKIYSKSVISEKEYNYVNALDEEEWLDEDINPKRRKKLHGSALLRGNEEPLGKRQRSMEENENARPSPSDIKRKETSVPHQDNHRLTPSFNKPQATVRRTVTDFFKPTITTPKPVVPLLRPQASAVLRVKVQVYGKVFLIPILHKNKSVQWLASEASKRYHTATGQRLLLKLNTLDGAELSPEDPLNSIISSNEDQFVAVRTSLNSSISLEKFYAKRCKELNRNQHKPLLQALSSAIKCGSFILPEKIPFDLSDMEPVLETLSYGLSGRLKELSIPYNALSDLNFPPTFFGLSGLKILNLSKCGLFGHHFMSESTSLPSLPSLDELDLSQNEIGSEAMMRVLSTYDTVTKLNIRKCGLTEDFHLPSDICERIAKLNIGGNSLSRKGIHRLLQSLNPSSLRTLDISHCGSFDSLQNILQLLREGGPSELPLETLDASGLDLKSTITDFDVLERVPSLRNLQISSNTSLSMPELERLIGGFYARNVPITQFEAVDLFSLYCYEEASEYNKFIQIFRRFIGNGSLVSLKLHIDEDDIPSSFIEELSSAWRNSHGPHSVIQSDNQILSFGYPV